MPPLLFLLRHADASDAADDASRPLSARGRGEIARLAALLRGSGAFRPNAVWHSPLVRAQQTADLLLRELGLRVPRQERRDLVPEANPELAAAALAATREVVAVCGHEPHLSALATLLVTGRTEPVAFAFQKATLLALEPFGPRCWVRWQLAPELFP